MSTPQASSTTYAKATMVQVSTVLLALFCAVTVIGLPIAAWLVLIALRRVVVDDQGIAVVPMGPTMRWADVHRLGIGFKEGALNRGDPMPLRTQTVHVLLADGTGKTMAVHPANLKNGRQLINDIKARAGCNVEPVRVSFPLNRLSFDPKDPTPR